MSNHSQTTPGYQSKTLAQSEIAVQILQVLKSGEMYSKEIAEELETKTGTVSNYLKGLRDHGLIKRTRRTKAQYYDITEKGEEFLKKKRKKDEIIQEANREIIRFLEGDAE
jgi:CRISPR locus-related DNA-binding protein